MERSWGGWGGLFLRGLLLRFSAWDLPLLQMRGDVPKPQSSGFLVEYRSHHATCSLPPRCPSSRAPQGASEWVPWRGMLSFFFFPAWVLEGRAGQEVLPLAEVQCPPPNPHKSIMLQREATHQRVHALDGSHLLKGGYNIHWEERKGAGPGRGCQGRGGGA